MSSTEISSLTLAPLDLPELEIARSRDVSGGNSASVDAGSVIAFVAGVDAQDQEDILFSLQFAQRAASGVADRYNAIADWYREYSRVLELTGWVLNGFAPNKQDLAEGEVQIAKAALKIVAAAATGPQTLVLTAAIEALESMTQDDGFITLFEHFGIKGQVGNFQMGAVERGPGGQLSIRLGAFQMKMSEKKRKFIFVKWREHEVSVWADAQTATFNRAHYAGMRERVRQMLGAEAVDAIAAISLAPLD